MNKLEKLLGLLRWRTEKAIEKTSALRPDRHFYCPKCLNIVLTFGKCPNCGVELRPVDEQFKAEYTRALREFCEKASKIVERMWPVLESWSRGVVAYLAGEGLVGVVFGKPRGLYNALGLYLEEGGSVRAVLGIHSISESELDKLTELIRVLREEGARGKVEVRAGLVPGEKLKSLGFEKDGVTWRLEL